MASNGSARIRCSPSCVAVNDHYTFGAPAREIRNENVGAEVQLGLIENQPASGTVDADLKRTGIKAPRAEASAFEEATMRVSR
jgi:hypothetical protein